MTEAHHKKIIVKIYKTLYSAFGPQNWWPGDTPFEIMVGAILTQNTNWGNAEKAINNLKTKRSLNSKTIHKMPHKRLASLIRPAGYFNIKAERLKNFLTFFSTHYKCSIKRMNDEGTYELREKLLDVNGIGPETADSILLYAFQRPVFVIDAYTKRVLTRHKVVPGNATYHELQDFFHVNFLPDVQLFNEYHALFVKVGKEYCRPKPRCERCPLNGITLPALNLITEAN